jgi:hypothetical protein
MLALFIPGVLVLPAILLITADSRDMTIFPRYISPALALMLLAFGLAMGQLWQWKAWIGKFITIVLLTLFAAGNIHQLFRFTRDGRGHYLQGLQFMREHGDGRIIVLSSDQELRHLKLLTFYARYLPDGSIIRPVPWESISARWPRWFVVSSLQAQDVPQEAYLGNLTFSNAPLDPQMAQKRYALRQIYPYYGPSGTLWAVYEVEN